MDEFITSGRAVDVVLAVIALEFVVLVARSRGQPRYQAAADAAFALAPGACLLLALRASLTEAGWPWIAFWIAASFPLHIVDLWRRRSTHPH